MQLIDALLGFAVLTGPLWLILILVPVAIWIAIKIAKRFEPRAAKIAVGVGTFLLVLFAPFADGIVGKIYFNHLCATQAGVKVYQTVELPAEHWDGEGRARFFDQYGNLDRDLWLKVLDESGGHVERYSFVFAIDKDTSPVKQRTTQTVLAEVTTFRYWGGWIRRNLSPHNTANSCAFISDSNFSRIFYGQLFKPLASPK